MIWLTYILLGLQTVQLTNPPPLLMGLGLDRGPVEFKVNRIDIGAYEAESPFMPMQRGDTSFDHEVTPIDVAWCTLCWKQGGPGAPYRETIRERATGKLRPVSCWVCDFDEDGDTDLADFAIHTRLLGE